MPTSPQNGGLHVCFVRLPALGRWVGFKPSFKLVLIFRFASSTAKKRHMARNPISMDQQALFLIEENQCNPEM